MSELVLTNVGETILNDLQKGAIRHERLPAEEARAIVADTLHVQRSDLWAPVDAIFERLAQSGRTFSNSADLLREDRDR